MGTITKSIGTSSRDYSTLQAWDDSLPANLVTDGNSYVGECYNDSEFGEMLTMQSNTTNSTYTITLKCAAGQSFRDHANVQTNALRYNSSYGVGNKRTASYATAIRVQGIANITVSGLQFSCTHSTSGTHSTNAGGSTDAPLFENCIFESGSTPFSSQQKPTLRNCLLVSTVSANHGFYWYYQTPTLENCTIVKSTTAGGTALKSHTGSGSVTVKNCAMFGFTTLISGTGSGNNNASDLAIGFGTSNQASKTYANQFQSTTTDYRLKSGADCVDNGATISAASPDIAGTSRPQGSAYDIGCWELVSAGGASNAPRYFHRTQMGMS